MSFPHIDLFNPEHPANKHGTMFRFLTTIRIAMGLTCVGVSVLLISRTLGLGQDEWSVAMQGRAMFSESLALHASAVVERGQGVSRLEEDMRTLVQRNPDVLSAGVRRDNDLVVDVGGHGDSWSTQGVDADQMFVPIASGQEDWGQVELRFRPLRAQGIASLVQGRGFRQLVFVVALGTLLSTFYLQKMLSHLDPSTVIPERVRSALDTFAEGLLVMDRDARIVLANRAFAETLEETNEELQGRQVAELPWAKRGKDNPFPWTETLSSSKARIGQMVDLQFTNATTITYMVNSSPIFSDAGTIQGVLASFDDVTLHEQRKKELERTLEVLGESREQIKQQNEELKVLATRDPLTGCLNRRSFFEMIDEAWSQGRTSGDSIACIMVDIDHFKAVNDNHGHSAGDEVLRCVGRKLREFVGEEGFACRYGGEEFCVSAVGVDEDGVRALAERLRRTIQDLKPADLKITASLGFSLTANYDDGSFQDLLEEADRSLYAAKNRGRNSVVCWNDVGEAELSAPENTRTKGDRRMHDDSPGGIPFHAVTALMSALSFRDVRTAEHSRRVADLCVMAAASQMSIREQYILETAALLHDIGKIGMPDSVLHKPGPLNDDERRVMQQRGDIGIDILQTVFSSEELMEILACYHSHYGGSLDDPSALAGEQIPIGARILAIADAYDAMITARVYRPPLTPQDAFAELRRSAGSQFDPTIVELFIRKVKAGLNRANGTETIAVPKETALRIGLLMERLTHAADAGDVEELKLQAKWISRAAGEARLSEIELAAARLEEVAEEDSDDADLAKITSSLLDLCRMTQKAYLDMDAAPRQLRERYSLQQLDETSVS